jgi:hypothetical protein
VSDSAPSANSVLTWLTIGTLIVSHARACMVDDKEVVKTGEQVGALVTRVAQLEGERMAAGRIEERLDGFIKTFERFADRTDRDLKELRDDSKRKR